MFTAFFVVLGTWPAFLLSAVERGSICSLDLCYIACVLPSATCKPGADVLGMLLCRLQFLLASMQLAQLLVQF